MIMMTITTSSFCRPPSVAGSRDDSPPRHSFCLCAASKWGAKMGESIWQISKQVGGPASQGRRLCVDAGE